MCQTCVDEGYLSQETYDKIQGFLGEYPSAEFGPTHIALGDCNVDDDNILYCLAEARKALADPENERPKGTLEAAIGFLEELLEIPEEIR